VFLSGKTAPLRVGNLEAPQATAQAGPGVASYDDAAYRTAGRCAHIRGIWAGLGANPIITGGAPKCVAIHCINLLLTRASLYRD